MSEFETGSTGVTEWARLFWDLLDFVAEERNYKLKMVRSLEEARDRPAGPESVAMLHRGFGPPQNIVVHYAFTLVLTWMTEDTSAAWTAVQMRWQEGDAGDAAAEARLDEFDRLFPQGVKSGPGVHLNIADYLLSSVDPVRWPN